MTDALQQQVLFYVVVGFFVLIGASSVAVLLGKFPQADKAFRKWAVLGFFGSVTAAVVGLFKGLSIVPPALITVTLLPPGDLSAPLVLDKGTYQYDEVASDESAKVVTHKGNVFAAASEGGGLQVRLPGVVVDKAVKLNFEDSGGNWWVAGPFYPNVIQQRMRAGQKIADDATHAGAGVMALMLVGGVRTPAELQQQATTRFNNYSRPSGNQAGHPFYEWRVFVDEKPEVLNTIRQVDYQLHPTFPEPFRSSTAREKNFELVTSGWGTFRILITIHYTNGTEAKTSYMLDFQKGWPVSSASARLRLDKIHVVEDGSTGGTGWVFDILMDGKPALALPKKTYKKNDDVTALDWVVQNLKLEKSHSVRIEVNGKRTFGGDTATGVGVLSADSGPLVVTVANKASSKKGSFVFTFSPVSS